MTILTWLVRLVIAALVLRLLARLFTGGRPQARVRNPPKPRVRAGGVLVQDPQCGTYIPLANALVLGRGEDAKYFCSETCRNQYVTGHGARHAS